MKLILNQRPLALLTVMTSTIAVAKIDASELDEPNGVHAGYAERENASSTVLFDDAGIGQSPSLPVDEIQRANYLATAPTERDPLTDQRQTKRDTTRTVVSTLSSLSIVIGLFLTVVWLLRRGNARTDQPLATDLCEVLGNVRLTNRHHAHVVRFADKLLLLSLTSSGAQVLGETNFEAVGVDRWRCESQSRAEANTSRETSPGRIKTTADPGKRAQAAVAQK